MILKLSKLFQNNTKWLEKKQTSILSAAFVITVANIASLTIGLLRDRLMISYYFNTLDSRQAYEAFQIAFQIPDMLFQLIVLGAVSAALIPIFTDLKKNSEKEAFEVTSTVMNILLLVFVVIAGLVAVFAEPLTQMRTGPEFTLQQVAIVVKLTRLMLFAQFFFAISSFLTGILQSYQRFVIAAIAPVLYNLGIIFGVILFSDQFGIYSAGLGVIIGAFLHMAIQLPQALKLGFRFKFNFSLKHPAVGKLFRMMPPRVMTLSVTEVQNFGLAYFATTVGDLSFVVIGLGMKLMKIPIRLFGVPIGQASLPFFSQESEQDKKKRFSSLVVQSLHQISFFALPASVLLLILRVPAVRLVFGADNFPWKTTVLTGKVVAILAISVAAQAMVQLLIRAFYAFKDTRTPFYIALVTVAFYLVMIAGSVSYTDSGVMGFAYATLVSAFIELSLFLIFLNQKLHFVLKKEFWWPQLKMLASSFLMAVFLYLPFRILDELVFDTSRTLELIALTVTTGTIGMLVYAYFSMLFEVRELRYFTKMFSMLEGWRDLFKDQQEILVETSVEGNEV